MALFSGITAESGNCSGKRCIRLRFIQRQMHDRHRHKINVHTRSLSDIEVL